MGSLQLQRTLMRMKQSEKMRPRSRFDEGGMAEDYAKEYDEEHELEHGDRTRRLEKYYNQGEQGFSRGGMARSREDGAGKVDGIHTSPGECSHLAAGGVCRHLAPSKKHLRNGSDEKFDRGGQAESFQSYLAKRHSARRMIQGGM